MIDLDGTGLINPKTSDYTIYEMLKPYDTFALFPQDFRKGLGRILRMDAQSGKIKFLRVAQKSESKSVFGSDQGGYYATTLLSGNDWIIRIYESSSGKLISEQKVP